MSMYPEKLGTFQLYKRVEILLQDYSPRKLEYGCQFQFSPLAIAHPRLQVQAGRGNYVMRLGGLQR